MFWVLYPENILRTHSIVIIKRAWTHSTHTLRILALWCHWQGSQGLGNSLKFTVHRELGLHCLLYDAFKRRAVLAIWILGPSLFEEATTPGIPCPLTRMAIFGWEVSILQLKNQLSKLFEVWNFQGHELPLYKSNWQLGSRFTCRPTV